jgi:hypothetical protein
MMLPKICVSLLGRVTMTLKSDTFSFRAVQQGRARSKSDTHILGSIMVHHNH